MTYPKVLESQVARSRARRWFERIASVDPVVHADGIGDLFQLFRAYLTGDLEQLRDLHRGLAGMPANQRTGHLDEVSELFEFSPDVEIVRNAARQFLDSSAAFDPLTILRALLARQAASAPPSVQLDTDEFDRYEARRQEARRRTIDGLAYHFGWLAERLDDVALLPGDTARTYMRLMFSAPVLIWHELSKQDDRFIGSQTLTLLAENLDRLLEGIKLLPKLVRLVSYPEIGGPLVLTLGAVGDSPDLDPTTKARLWRWTQDLVGSDPQPLLTAWKASEEGAPLAAMLGRELSRWIGLATRFFGFAPAAVRWELERTWGCLLQLQEADLASSPKQGELFAVATALYGSTPKWQEVWQKYLAARRNGQLPVVIEVRGPECPTCRVVLPTQRAQALKRGDAVLCERNQHILLLQA